MTFPISISSYVKYPIRFLTVLCTAYCIGWSSPTVAQSFNAQALLGINGTQIDGDGLGGYNQAGVLGGLKVGIPLSDYVSLQAGMLYGAKGSRNSEAEPFTIWRLSYLELPIEIVGQLMDRLYLFGGLSPNYLIKAQVDEGFGFVSNRNNFRNFDLCYTAGILYRFADNLGAQARISEGFGSSSQLQYLQNRTLGFALVYFFEGQ